MTTVSRLQIIAAVRYWEDATVNGVEDAGGTLIPFRNGDLWSPVIHLRTGRILDWPQGTVASIHYKVCDAGKYWLQDATGKDIARYDDDYVPSCLSPGDYIIMDIGADGCIADWSVPVLALADWPPIARQQTHWEVTG